MDKIAEATSDASPDVKLENKWSFWYSPRGRNSKPDASENYETQLTHLGDAETVREFFSYYLYLRKPDEVGTDHKMIIFRKNHAPLWEVSRFLTLRNGPRAGAGYCRLRRKKTPIGTTSSGKDSCLRVCQKNSTIKT